MKIRGPKSPGFLGPETRTPQLQPVIGKHSGVRATARAPTRSLGNTRGEGAGARIPSGWVN